MGIPISKYDWAFLYEYSDSGIEGLLAIMYFEGTEVLTIGTPLIIFYGIWNLVSGFAGNPGWFESAKVWLTLCKVIWLSGRLRIAMAGFFLFLVRDDLHLYRLVIKKARLYSLDPPWTSGTRGAIGSNSTALWIVDIINSSYRSFWKWIRSWSRLLWFVECS